MTSFTRCSFRISSVIVGMLAVSAAQQPAIENGRVTTSSAGPSLGQSIQKLVAAQTDAVWIGYSVPVVAGERTMCCDSGTWINGAVVRSDGGACCPTCRLEPSGSSSTISKSPQAQSGLVKLEGSGQMTVLLRVSERQVERVRIFAQECRLDAGGRQVFWLENVRAPESIAYLESLVASQTDRRD